MSTNSFIPTIWIASLLRVLPKSLVYRAITNENYKKDVNNTDSVVINQIGTVSTEDYVQANGITFNELQTTGQTMLLDQKKDFGIYVDDVNYAQVANGGALMDAAMAEAAYSFNDGVDQALAAEYANAGIIGGSGASALGTSASPLEITVDGGGTSTKVRDWIGTLNRRCKEANMPDGMEKTLIIPPWLEQKMINATLIDNRGVDNNGTYENGKITKVQNFTIKVSNNVSSSGTTYRVMAGNSNCIAFADQVKRIKYGERSAQFEKFVAGLYVYGYKTIRADQLLCSQVTEGTEGQ